VIDNRGCCGYGKFKDRRKMFEAFNEKFNQSKIGKFFELEDRGSNFTTELQGATATFLTMSYILAVNPAILADTDGSCYAQEDPESCSSFDVKKQYVVATAIASMFACFAMGILANLPIALSCGMGMNAFFAYNVVGFKGFGDVPYRAAISIVFIEGLIFFVLAITGARFALVKLIPEPVRAATPAAIGAFLAHLGLQTAEGIGLVVADTATGLTLGGCSPDNRIDVAAVGGFPEGQYTCDGGKGTMQSATTWLGLLGTMIMIILMSYKIRSSLLIGISFVTIISWFRNTAVSYFPDNEQGDAMFDYFTKVVSIEKLDLVFFQYDFNAIEGSGAFFALITLLYVDFLDTSGTLIALIGTMDLLDENGDFPKSRYAFSVDAIATMFGSLFGLSPLTSYIESAAGVELGSRTGLTAVMVGVYFFISIFFAPILASIPPWATGGALVIVGSLMARSLLTINWHNHAHAFSAFVTLIMMPLTYSIAYGLIFGIASWWLMKLVFLPLQYFFNIPDPTAEEPINSEESKQIQATSKQEGSDNAPEQPVPVEGAPVESA